MYPPGTHSPPLGTTWPPHDTVAYIVCQRYGFVMLTRADLYECFRVD